jgi:hypothetical protein
MSANVVRLERLFRRTWDWSPPELAEFYRVEAALIQAGMRIDTERGLSDEGDPWFAFCRLDDAEVIVHIARIGGLYILAGASYDGVASGNDIAALVHDLVGRHPLIQVRGNTRRPGAKIFLHPAALLIAVVATAFFKSAEARALTDEHKAGEGRGGGSAALKSETVSGADAHHSVAMDAAQSVAILSAVVAALQAAPGAEPDTTTSLASTSDLVDFAILSPPGLHSVSSLSVPTPTGVLAHQDVEALTSGGLLNNAPAQHILEVANVSAHALQVASTPAHILEVAKAPTLVAEVASAPAHLVEATNTLPLIAILWDLSNRPVTKTIGNDTGYASAASLATNPTSLATESPIVAFRLPTNDVNNSLPVIQAAKISYSGSQGLVETHTVAQSDAVPAALANALKAATHSTIEAQPVGVPNASFANGLITSLTEQPGNQFNANTHTLPTSSLPTSSAPTSSAPTSSAPTSSAPTSAPLDSGTKPIQPVSQPAAPNHQNAMDVQAAVQDFLKNSPNLSFVNEGNGLVVYDTSALASHPSEVKSVAFDFSDGSTLSLVGLPASLPHLHVG